MKHTTTINTESYTQIERICLMIYALLVASLIVAFPLITDSINSIILFMDGAKSSPNFASYLIGIREHFESLGSSEKIELLTSVYGMISIIFLFSCIRILNRYPNLEDKIHSLLNLALNLVIIVAFISTILDH